MVKFSNKAWKIVNRKVEENTMNIFQRLSSLKNEAKSSNSKLKRKKLGDIINNIETNIGLELYKAKMFDNITFSEYSIVPEIKE